MNNELYHYGVPGMKWGQRRAALRAEYKARVKNAYGDRDKIAKAKADYKKAKSDYDNSMEGQIAKMEHKRKVGRTATIAALGVVGVMAATAPYRTIYEVSKGLGWID